MKASILFLVLVCVAAAVSAQRGSDNSDVVAAEGELRDISDDNLEDFMKAFKEVDKEKMAKLTHKIVEFSESFQRRTKLMSAVKSTVVKIMKRFTDLESFAALRAVILNHLTKLASEDDRTPADLQSMIDWVEKRKIDGTSVDVHLDEAAARLKVAKGSFRAVQAKAKQAIEGVRDATAPGQPFDQEKVRALIKEAVDAFDANRDTFLPNIEAAVKGFDLTYSNLRV